MTAHCMPLNFLGAVHGVQRFPSEAEFRVAFFATGGSFSEASALNPRRARHASPENRGALEAICQNRHALPPPRGIHSAFSPTLNGEPGTCERLHFLVWSESACIAGRWRTYGAGSRVRTGSWVPCGDGSPALPRAIG